MHNICVSLSASNPEEFIAQLQQLQKEHDFFELRLDALEDPTVAAIEEVLTNCSVDVIATIRSEAEGGAFAGNLDQQANLVRACLTSKAAYCDIELTLAEAKPELVEMRDQKELLITHHDFELTPDDEALQAIIARMKAVAPDAIVKIACMADTAEDVVRLTKLQKSFPAGTSVVIAMGEKGQLLRLIGPSLGAFTSFASSTEQPVAPGQLYYNKMKSLMDAMELQDGRQ